MFSSVFKFLVQKNKNAKVAANPLKMQVLQLFSEIERNANESIIDILEATPGLRAILREEKLKIPEKISIMRVYMKVSQLKEKWRDEKEGVRREIRGRMVGRRDGEERKEGEGSTVEEIGNEAQKVMEMMVGMIKFCLTGKIELILVMGFNFFN